MWSGAVNGCPRTQVNALENSSPDASADSDGKNFSETALDSARYTEISSLDMARLSTRNLAKLVNRFSAGLKSKQFNHNDTTHQILFGLRPKSLLCDSVLQSGGH
jgi:hypothetical protein